MAHLNEALGLQDLFKPLATASTRSSDEQTGRPTVEDKGEQLGDEASESRDKRERNG